MKMFASTWGVSALIAIGCGGGDARAPSDAAPAIAVAPPPRCAAPVPVWKDGKLGDAVCPDDAAARGLTIIDLADDWTPAVLSPPGVPPPRYRAAYLALATERWADAGADGDVASSDRYLELYGIEPALSVIRTRLADDARPACHAAIADAPLAAMAGRVIEEPRPVSNLRIARARGLRAELERQRTRRRLADVDALAAVGPSWRAAVAALHAAETRLAGIRAVQQHLVCDGLYDPRHLDGNYTWETATPVERFQRATMVLPHGYLDADTRDAFLIGSRERDFRTALRALRERVIAATGLVEDGTAGAGETPVLGRALEPASTWRAKGYAAEPRAAPDLIDPATEAAARALGWTDAGAVLAFLDAHGAHGDAPQPRVAIALAPLPAYHRAQMDLSVVIDRGDVWYDPVPISRDPQRRPSMTLYVNDAAAGGRIALVRWPTTIGGWQDEKSESWEVDKKWKESPVGPRVWHDVWITPTWIPPDGTPDKDLVRVGVDERLHLRKDVLGPGYRSAFGLVAMVHEVPIKRRGVITYDEEGIRTHGAANLSSIARGISHGCHRLLGVDALRLAGFVLGHRSHEVKGEAETWWRRKVRYHGRVFAAALDTRGYLVTIDPPVPVQVLPGRIRSLRKRPYR